MLPKVMACVGQADWQAVTTSPSPIARPSFSAWMRAAEMRWMQKLHFSMTPRLRTVTSGLRPPRSDSVSRSAYCRKLKRRTE